MAGDSCHQTYLLCCFAWRGHMDCRGRLILHLWYHFLYLASAVLWPHAMAFVRARRQRVPLHGHSAVCNIAAIIVPRNYHHNTTLKMRLNIFDH